MSDNNCKKKWYRVSLRYSKSEITCPRVTKVTEKTITYIDDRWDREYAHREMLSAMGHKWFNDLEEARSYALEYIAAKRHGYETRLAELAESQQEVNDYNG